MLQKTESEVAFEEACHFFNIKFEPISRSDNQSPDYKIELSGNIVFAEVKQFDLNEQEKRALQEMQTKGSTAYFPGEDRRIRTKIHEANSQLKSLTENKYPGVAILFVGSSIGSFDSEEIHAAMYGNESYNFAVPRGGAGDAKSLGASLAPNGICKPERHTTTSAVVSLWRIDSSQFRMNFYHNTFAKNPVNPDWLCCDGIRYFASKQADESSLPEWVRI